MAPPDTFDTRTLRALRSADAPSVRRILDTSEYTHVRFNPEEVPTLLGTLPAFGVASAPSGRLARVTTGSLRAFLLLNWLVAPSAWIGGFGVTWSEGARYAEYLRALLPPLARAAAARGATHLYYSGGNAESDWLRAPLEACGFGLVTLLRSYDKDDTALPNTTGANERVRVRPFTPADIEGVLAVEQQCFDQLWRHDAASFLDVAASYPYFVVAEDDQGIAGYQFNTLDATTGYLVRIAVHPRAAGQGIGARLMTEAIAYFRQERVWRILLNTEERNTRARALYERFGFHLVEPRGFVLGGAIAQLAAL
ncbi:MAG: hypothetical protein OJF49_002793 [Ktedonobacterales bacterium]|jgi:ribosomal protein S18 acetylase RimI-like enzyme|nr:MAG: hypothetical protein OJF49_002793 [Ktedonobacterales bacterium]